MGDGAMRALKFATIAMGVLIIVGVSVLVVAMVRRGTSAPALPANLSAILDEPAGTRIVTITTVQDRLAVQLNGGGADRVVLVDPRSGSVVGRVVLAR